MPAAFEAGGAFCASAGAAASAAIAFGLAIGVALAALVCVLQKLGGQPPYYWQIMVPGGILGVIVGYATFTVRSGSARSAAQAR